MISTIRRKARLSVGKGHKVKRCFGVCRPAGKEKRSKPKETSEKQTKEVSTGDAPSKSTKVSVVSASPYNWYSISIRNILHTWCSHTFSPVFLEEYHVGQI